MDRHEQKQHVPPTGERLMRFLDGEMEPAEREEFTRWLAADEQESAEAARFRRIGDLVRENAREQAAQVSFGALSGRIFGALEEQETRHNRRVWLWYRWVTAASVAMFIATVSLLPLREREQEARVRGMVSALHQEVVAQGAPVEEGTLLAERAAEPVRDNLSVVGVAPSRGPLPARVAVAREERAALAVRSGALRPSAPVVAQRAPEPEQAEAEQPRPDMVARMDQAQDDGDGSAERRAWGREPGAARARSVRAAMPRQAAEHARAARDERLEAAQDAPTQPLARGESQAQQEESPLMEAERSGYYARQPMPQTRVLAIHNASNVSVMQMEADDGTPVIWTTEY